MDGFQTTPYTYVGLNCAKTSISCKKGRVSNRYKDLLYIYVFSLQEKTTQTASIYYWVQVFQNAIQTSKCYLHKKIDGIKQNSCSV